MLPSARPGTRAPHCWIGEGRSTLDLFGDGFVLVRFSAPELPVEQLTVAAKIRGVPLQVVDLENSEAETLYEKRLVLVRPDCHIAWRGDTLPEDALNLIDLVRGV